MSVFTKEETLYVGLNDSRCGYCGKSANPAQFTHEVLLGYGPDNGRPGCGVRWKYVASTYSGQEAEDAVRLLRPDLEYVGIGIR